MYLTRICMLALALFVALPLHAAITIGTVEGSGKTLATDTAAPYDINPSKPSDVVDGDHVVMSCHIRQSTTLVMSFTPPTGFTEIASQTSPVSSRPAYWIGYRLAASDPASYQFQASVVSGTSTHGQCIVFRVTGASTSDFLDVAVPAAAGGTSANPTSSSITTATNDSYLVSVVGTNDGRHVTATDSNGPSGHTVGYLRSSGVSSNGVTSGYSFVAVPTAGAIGASVWTGALTTSNGWYGTSFAIRPAAGGGGASGLLLRRRRN